MADDEIDTETLQAQIDMSLAFAQDLVSSWIKPLKTAPASSSKKQSKDADKEIEELLRRPPRLGVGAPLPESTSMSGRDTVRLRKKLTGTKHPRENDETVAKGGGNAGEDDEEESRAGAIRKRVKVDPFSVGGKKKKGKGKEKEVDMRDCPRSTEVKVVDMKDATLSQDGRRDGAESLAESREANVDSIGTGSDMKGQEGDDAADVRSGAQEGKSGKKKKKKKNSPASPATETVSDLSSQVPETPKGLRAATSVTQPTPTATATSKSQSASVSPSKSPQLSAHKSVSKHNPYVIPSNLPVLNLTGPPPAIDDTEDHNANTSPKKKRKRKKKKKKGNQAEPTADQTS